MDGTNDQTLIHEAWPDEQPEADGKARAYLIVVAGRGVGEMFSLERGPMTIGRGSECDIVLFDNAVSRHHARIELANDASIYLTDLGSTNGTFVNDARIKAHQLRDGEKIRIGSTTILKFSYQDNIEAEFQKALRRGAIVDPLTQAYNRRYITDRLATDFSHATRHRRPLSLILFDIDHFKLINDTHGHLAGDTVLVRLVETVRPHLRKEDALGRYGGEEFIMLLRDTDRQDARHFAERLRHIISASIFEHDGRQIQVTISAGLASIDDADYADPTQLLQAADASLYAAKRSGRNRVVCAHTREDDTNMAGAHTST